MSLLIESIKLLDGRFHNLFYHEQRMIRSLETLCGTDEDLNLEAFLAELNAPKQGLFKCRIEYDEFRKEVEFIPYEARPVTSLKLVENNGITYEFKYADRKAIDKLFKQRETCDDILIAKRGIITDASAANIVFKKGRQWFTPWAPLLRGTQRQKLIDENRIFEEEIRTGDIPSFQAFKLINAMLEFDGPEIEVKNILL